MEVDTAPNVAKAPAAGARAAMAAGPSAAGLSAPQLRDMFEQCLRLAVENKITDKNVWQIPLINHFSDIVRTEDSSDFNFHRATGGLEASVKIYDKRVEATYKMTYSMLGGLGGRAEEGAPRSLGFAALLVALTATGVATMFTSPTTAVV